MLRDPRLCGASADPNNPGLPPGGNPQHVRYLQAALDAEMKHIAMLAKAGAVASARSFFFPAAIFQRLGSSQEPGSLLGVLEMLETVVIGAYITAAAVFLRLGQPDLSVTAAQVMGVEAEHRTLGRVIAALTPPNNVTIERAPYGCMGEAATALGPFLSGRRYLFATGPAVGVAVPSAAQADRVIGKYATRTVPRYQFGPNGA